MNRRELIKSSGVVITGPLLAEALLPSFATAQSAQATPLSTALLATVKESMITVANRAAARTATASDYAAAAAQAQSLYNAMVANNFDLAFEPIHARNVLAGIAVE